MSSGTDPTLTLAACLLLSVASGLLTAALIPKIGPHFKAKGIKGLDLLKGYDRRPSKERERLEMSVQYLF